MSSATTHSGVEGFLITCEPSPAMTLEKDDLLHALRDRGVKNVEIARVLDLPSSRIAEMFNGRRQLKLEEANKLIQHFGIGEARGGATALSLPIARLLVLYVADGVGKRLEQDDPLVAELARDVQAFSEFATDPEVMANADIAEGFLRAARVLRRPGAA